MAEGERSQSKLRSNIGRYQIQGNLGAGAMGAVYKGYDPLIKRTLAIKTIRLDIPRDSEEYKSFLDRFYQEARISGTLAHPNIVTLFDIGEDKGLPFLALEYIEGETVDAMLQRGVKFRPEKVIGLVSQIASALDYAHSKGVIHRDIKPANLLVSDEDRVKVMDFGIAKLADSEITKVGQLVGTPSYMSPEQALGEKIDGRSDIFSLGVCAFVMLSGQQPFPGNNVTAILYKLVNSPPIEPDNLEMNGLIPQKWHEVFGKVLAKKREQRYQTAADFVRDLELCLGSWFSGLGDELVPTESVPLPTIPAGADDPSVVVSIDELQAVLPATQAASGRPAAAALPDDDDMPQTLAMEQGDHLPPTVAMERPRVPLPPPDEDDLPSTVAVPRPGAPLPPADDDLPETVAVPRPSEEKTVWLAGSTPPTVAEPEAPMPKAASGPLPSYKRPGARPVIPPRPSAQRSSAGSRPGVQLESSQPGVQLEPSQPELPPTEQAPRPGPPKGLVAGGIGAVVLLALAGYFALRGGGAPGPGPTGAPPPASGKGAVQVQTTPAGAAVTAYDVASGHTFSALSSLPPGTYEVIAELKDHEPAVEKVTLKEGDPPASVNLTLEPSRSAMSAADILSRPPGATVEVDGARVGQTPLRGHGLRVGNRRILLTTEGYQPYAAFLTVEEGKTARLDARLAAIDSAVGGDATPETPEPAPVATATPRRAPAAKARPSAAPPTTLRAAASAEPAPPPTLAPAPPSVDTSKVYRESEVDTPPRKLSGDSHQPRLRSGEEVSVTLTWTVTENGEVADVEIVQSGGKLDEPVSQALRKWKYAPGVKQGVQVKVRMARKYTFRAG